MLRRRASGWLGSRRLVRDMQGEDVSDLQRRLSDLGYDVGTLDGIFGFMTQDALREFQREHGLRPDGIAGAAVLGLLAAPGLPMKRTLYTVREGETFTQVARLHGITLQALRHMNRLRVRARPYAGRRLVIRSHYVMGYVPGSESETAALRTAAREAGALSALAGAWIALTPEGELTGAVPDDWLQLAAERGIELFPTLHNWSPAGALLPGLRPLLHQRRRRQAAISRLLDLARSAPVAGFAVDLGGLGFGDGSPFVRFVRQLATGLHRRQMRLIVTLPVAGRSSWWRQWADDLDYEAIGAVCDQVVAGAHHGGIGSPGPLPPAPAERAIARLVARVPPWKLLYGIKLGAWVRQREPTLEGPALWQEASYQQAMTGAYLGRVRPERDPESGARAFETSALAGVIESRESFAARLACIDRYALAGVALWRVGDEDRRIWDEILRRMKVRRASLLPDRGA